VEAFATSDREPFPKWAEMKAKRRLQVEFLGAFPTTMEARPN